MTTRSFSWSFGSSDLTYTINSGNASNFENIAGGQGDDTLTGDANANVILGGKGNDTIYGEAGNDKLYGGISPDSSGNNLTNSLNLTVGQRSGLMNWLDCFPKSLD